MPISQVKLDELRDNSWAWASWPKVDNPVDLGLVLKALFMGRLDQIIEIESISLEKYGKEYDHMGFAGISLMFSVLDFIGNFYNGNPDPNKVTVDIKDLIINELGKIDINYSKNAELLVKLRNCAIHSQMVCNGAMLVAGKGNDAVHLITNKNELYIYLYRLRLDIEKLINEYSGSFDLKKYNKAISVYNILRKNGELRIV